MRICDLEIGDGYTVYTLPKAGDVALRVPAAEAHRLGRLLRDGLKARGAYIDEYPAALAAAMINNGERLLARAPPSGAG